MALSICLSFVLTACGNGGGSGLSSDSKNNAGSGDYNYGSSNNDNSSSRPEDEEPENTGAENDLDERKLIRNARMTVESKHYDSFLEELQKTVTSYDGYMQSMNSQNSKSHYANRREATMVIRVPAANYQTFMSLVSELGNVLHTSEELEDVTLTYIDIESHINALRTEEESLLRLMEDAKNLSDLLTIQSKLTEVRYSIESYESQLLKYDDLISYSTITMTLYEVEEETVTEEQGVLDEIGSRFADSCSGVLNIAKGFLIMFIGNLPYLLFAAAVIVFPIWLIIFLIRHSEKKRMKKKAAREQSTDNNPQKL